MRLPASNKSGGPAANPCHHCGRTVSERSCRQELSGWYCQQKGLLLGEGVELVTPEPVPSPWENDPTVTTATETETAAQLEYDKANIAWETAIRKLAEHRILDSTNSGYNTRGEWITGKTNTNTRDKLVRAETAARKQRDDTATALRLARVAYHSALEKAHHPAVPHSRQW